MKLKQITLIDACRRASEGNVYIMIHLTEETSDELIKLGDAYFTEEKEAEPQAQPFREDPEPEEPKAQLVKEVDTPKKETERDGKICALYNAGWTIANIAKEVQCSDQTVRNVLKRKGLRQ